MSEEFTVKVTQSVETKLEVLEKQLDKLNNITEDAKWVNDRVDFLEHRMETRDVDLGRASDNFISLELIIKEFSLSLRAVPENPSENKR